MYTVFDVEMFLRAFRDQFYFLSYATGSGGEKFIYELSRTAKNIIPYQSEVTPSNKWSIDDNFWRGRLSGGRRDAQWNSISDLVSDLDFSTDYPQAYYYQQYLKREFALGKIYLSKAHCYNKSILTLFDKSKHLYQYHSSREELEYAEYLRIIKVWLGNRISSFDDLKKRGLATGSLIARQILVENEQYFRTLFEKGSCTDYLLNIVAWTPEVINKLGFNNISDIPHEVILNDEIVMLYLNRIFKNDLVDNRVNRIAKLGLNPNFAHISDFKSITMLSISDMLNGNIVGNKINIEMDSTQFTLAMTEWNNTNLALINDFQSKYNFKFI